MKTNNWVLNVVFLGGLVAGILSGYIIWSKGADRLENQLSEEREWAREKINEISDMADSLWRDNARLEDENAKMRLVLELAGYSPDSAFLSLLPGNAPALNVFSGTTGQVSSAQPLEPAPLPRLSSVPPIQLRWLIDSLVLHKAFDVDWGEKPVVDFHLRQGGMYRVWWESDDR